MPRIFISHSSKDNAFADQLAYALRAQNAEVWIDLSDIPAGMKWSSAIQQGLDACEVMLLIISPDSMASSNVEDEWQYYIDNNKLIIPVLWIPTKVHFQLGRYQYVDFHQPEFEAALDRLIRELARHGHRLNAPAPPPTPAVRAEPTTAQPFARPPAQSQVVDRVSWQQRAAQMIEETLDSFGAPGQVVSINSGAVVTQFGVEPGYLRQRGDKKVRVKVSAIAALESDIALALAVPSVRLEAPVPGKGYVGIEVPHPSPQVVRLQDVLDSAAFQQITSPLVIPVGQTMDGSYIAADLTAMSHLLIGGAQASGKSVFLSALIASLLLQHKPSALKLAIDAPSGDALLRFDGIPHLLAPVAKPPNEGVNVLKWAVREMNERYRHFSAAGVRNITQYNMQANAGSSLPYIVVIISELDDLMLVEPDETERSLLRLTPLARVTGIHLIIATENTSVFPVPALIKEGFPTRIAFAVKSAGDSRVLLQMPGAERLLGKGDMLYLRGDMSTPIRVQGAYVSDTEISEIARFWREQAAPVAAEKRETQQPSLQAVLTELDPILPQAIELARSAGTASPTMLQSKLTIGYPRAARLIQYMIELGILSSELDTATRSHKVRHP